MYAGETAQFLRLILRGRKVETVSSPHPLITTLGRRINHENPNERRAYHMAKQKLSDRSWKRPGISTAHDPAGYGELPDATRTGEDPAGNDFS